MPERREVMTFVMLFLAQANGLTVPPVCWVICGVAAALSVTSTVLTIVRKKYF